MADDFVHDPGHDIERMIIRPDFDQPRSGPARTGQFEMIAGQPHDEDFGLDRALDVKTIREACHRPIVRRGRGHDYSVS